MKKIKKLDPVAAQSVFAFACPCMGVCEKCEPVQNYMSGSGSTTSQAGDIGPSW